MKLGIELDWQSRHFKVPVERVKLADRLGYDMVFTAEGNGSDCISPLGFVLGITDRIGVGTHIAPTIGRSPAQLAMAYQTLRHMGGPDREIIAGLGSSIAQLAEGWHGQPWTKPYWRMQEYISIMRQAARGEAVACDGKIFTIPYHAQGEEPKHQSVPPLLETDPNIPIMFGGGTELMLTLAAQIADGWMPLSYAPGMMKAYRPFLEKGLAKRATPIKLEDFPIWTHVDVLITDDVKDAIRQFKNYTARWAGGWGNAASEPSPFAQQMIWRGYGDVLPRIQELYSAGHHEAAADAVPDEFIDEGWLFGPLPRVVERWKSKWINQGVNFIVRTDNWPAAKASGDMAFEPLLRAARD